MGRPGGGRRSRPLVAGVFEERALALGTDHHAWASELRLLSGDLVARLRAADIDIASLTVQVSPWEGRGW